MAQILQTLSDKVYSMKKPCYPTILFLNNDKVYINQKIVFTFGIL